MEWIKKFKRLPYFFHFLYEKVTTSIAFYPTLIAIFFLMLTALMLFLEDQGLTSWVNENIPLFLIIKSWSVAQSVLTTLVGALISLMVFSFSMVMVLLNNAASNYSPRILPSLVSNKFHQFVLGTYLGSITYCLLLAINLTPTLSDVTVPSISILLGIFFGLSCLMIFVFFIHSISEAVQVGKILDLITAVTIEKLENGILVELIDAPAPTTDSWTFYQADRTGYLKVIDGIAINKLCSKHQIKIKVLAYKGNFTLDDSDLFCCDKELEETVLAEILEKFVFSENENAIDDHAVGFRQINEIALKAMSPGINDPGTAILAINKLTILFAKKMELKFGEAFPVGKEQGAVSSVCLWLNVISFGELLEYVLVSLRAYARHDLIVVKKMLDMLKFLALRDYADRDNLRVIQREIEKIRVDAREYLTNPADYQVVVRVIQQIEEHIEKKI